MNESKATADGITIGKLWSDEELCGRIYCQVMNLSVDATLGAQKERFLDHAFDAMHKLSATRYHLDNYIRIERQHAERLRRIFKKHPGQREEAFELIYELEAFLFQVKSSLDMLVKLIDPVIGDRTVRTQTFGDKGDAVVKGLEQYKKRNDANTRAADDLISVVKDDKDAWLARVVALRDTVAHFKGLRHYQFEPVRLPDGGVGVQPPRFNGVDTVGFMRLAYANNIAFHQDFMCLTLALKVPGLVLVRADANQMANQYGKYGKHVRWGWGMKNPET